MEHNIVELRDRFYKLVDKLMTEFRLACYLNEERPEDVYNAWDEYNDAADHYGIWVGTGATKLVIGDDANDYVIKIQPPKVDSFDYCQREVDVYNEAVVRGFADKFAWTAKLFDYVAVCQGAFLTIPVYVMEYCQCDYDMIDDEMDSYHYHKFCTSRGLTPGDDAIIIYDEEGRDTLDYSEKMMIWACDCWGCDFNGYDGCPIARFMREMYINDIHAGNWGWCGDRLVLTDYSGYGSDLEARDIYY